MLVLSRKIGQGITVEKDGEKIEIFVVKKRGNHVTIGVKASLNHRITRDDAKKRD